MGCGKGHVDRIFGVSGKAEVVGCARQHYKTTTIKTHSGMDVYKACSRDSKVPMTNQSTVPPQFTPGTNEFIGFTQKAGVRGNCQECG